MTRNTYRKALMPGAGFILQHGATVYSYMHAYMCSRVYTCVLCTYARALFCKDDVHVYTCTCI